MNAGPMQRIDDAPDCDTEVSFNGRLRQSRRVRSYPQRHRDCGRKSFSLERPFVLFVSCAKAGRKTVVTMFVRHTVSNYQSWRKLYDGFALVQKAKGVTAEAVYQAVDNSNDVTVTHDFATLETAQAFAKSEELRKAMQSAGIVGAPTIWFTNKV
jgi:hypothetical protein